MDSDRANDKSQKDALRAENISIFDWDEANSIEEQIFHDVPTDIASRLIEIATKEYGIDSIKSRLSSVSYWEQDNHIVLDTIDDEVRKSIGSIAKKKGVEWYKRIGLGESLGNVVFENWDIIDTNSRLKKVVNDIINWVTKND